MGLGNPCNSINREQLLTIGHASKNILSCLVYVQACRVVDELLIVTEAEEQVVYVRSVLGQKTRHVHC